MRTAIFGFLVLISACGAPASAEPLVIGETFTMVSKALGETRRINVYKPPTASDEPLPVLYVLDGGVKEDFLHIAGLVQVSAGNGTMRPSLLVGIENTERRRDLTPPTTNPEDKKIAPRVGGSALFRTFVRDELIPEVERRYPVTKERAIVGESAAGLFIVETLLVEPKLFDTYVAVDPSLWWNNGALVKEADARLQAITDPKAVFLTSSTDGNAEPVSRFGVILGKHAKAGRLRVFYQPMNETHATIFHPAALKAFRELLKPEKK